MGEFVPVAKTADIPEQTVSCVEAAGKRIAVCHFGGEFFAIDDTCTHAEASLSEGTLAGDEIMCPLHMATFNIRTGACTGPPADEDLATYPVRINGDTIEIEV